MTNKFLTIAMLIALFLNSCKETPKQENTEEKKPIESKVFWGLNGND